MKKLVIAAAIAALMILAAFTGYEYAIRTATMTGYYIEDNSLVCYDITYRNGATTYHYGE